MVYCENPEQIFSPIVSCLQKLCPKCMGPIPWHTPVNHLDITFFFMALSRTANKVKYYDQWCVVKSHVFKVMQLKQLNEISAFYTVVSNCMWNWSLSYASSATSAMHEVGIVLDFLCCFKMYLGVLQRSFLDLFKREKHCTALLLSGHDINVQSNSD